MAIKKYYATADNTISNAFDETLLSSNRATGSNMGASDILEVFQKSINVSIKDTSGKVLNHIDLSY